MTETVPIPLFLLFGAFAWAVGLVTGYWLGRHDYE